MEVQQELMETKQKKGEVLENYICRLENIGLKDSISEDVIFSAIMQGMDTELRVIVAQKNPSNLAELSSYADQAETVRRIQQKNKEERKDQQDEHLFEKLAAHLKPMLESKSVNASSGHSGQRNL